MVYANADIAKATQNREAIAFCDHWKAVSGSDPKMLIMDQKVTTQAILGELDARGVKFATLRMRSASLMNRINSLAGKDYETITLDRPGPYNRPRVHEDPAVTLTSYPGTVRQLIVTGLGRDAPTVIITNGDQIKTRALISQYARRMTIEQRLAEIIGAFCADALSSTVNLNADLDVVLCVLAQALLAASAPGSAPATPPPPPTPSSGASSTPPEPSPPMATPSPSPSADAPTHPSCASPTSAPTPPSPGGKPVPPLPVQLAGGTIRCMEIRAKQSRASTRRPSWRRRTPAFVRMRTRARGESDRQRQVKVVRGKAAVTMLVAAAKAAKRPRVGCRLAGPDDSAACSRGSCPQLRPLQFSALTAGPALQAASDVRWPIRGPIVA
jgi:hypothetical protein